MAKREQFKEVGTLGSGNHYLEVQYIADVYDEEAAKRLGLFKERIMISLHTGSRALGHQIGTDYLRILAEASKKYHIPIIERELVCAPVITFIPLREKSCDGYEWEEACRILEENGADVVGLNCARGPDTIIPLLEKIRKKVSGYVAALPVPYPTTKEQLCFYDLKPQCSCQQVFT